MKTVYCSIKAPDTGEILLSAFKTEVGCVRRTFTAHHHTSFEIAYFQKGKGTYMVSDRSYEFSAGDIFLFSTDEVHFISDICEDISAFVLHIAPFFIWAPGEGLFDYSFLQVFFENKERFGNRIAGDTAIAQSVATILREIEHECITAPSHYELMVKAKLLNVLITLLRAFPMRTKEERAPLPGRSGVNAVQHVMTYINDHYTEDLTLEVLAEVAGVSRNYLSSVFRRLNGMNIWSYILIKRIELAKSYLAKTNRPILDIAFACGFNTAAHFNKTFKHLTAQSPSEYRRTHALP